MVTTLNKVAIHCPVVWLMSYFCFVQLNVVYIRLLSFLFPISGLSWKINFPKILEPVSVPKVLQSPNYWFDIRTTTPNWLTNEYCGLWKQLQRFATLFVLSWHHLTMMDRSFCWQVTCIWSKAENSSTLARRNLMVTPGWKCWGSEPLGCSHPGIFQMVVLPINYVLSVNWDNSAIPIANPHSETIARLMTGAVLCTYCV